MVSSSILYFLMLSSGREKEVREGNREVLQLTRETFEHVSKEEGATVTGGTSHFILPTHMNM